MGDWRTVHIIGTCAESEVRDLRRECDPGEDYKHFNCLSVTNGLGGLADWPASQINARGNLAERNFTVEDVQKQLEKLAEVCPSLTVKVHCGGEYEDKTVIATITLAAGKATIGPPEMQEIAEITEAEMQARLMRGLLLARRF